MITVERKENSFIISDRYQSFIIVKEDIEELIDLLLSMRIEQASK